MHSSWGDGWRSWRLRKGSYYQRIQVPTIEVLYLISHWSGWGPFIKGSFMKNHHGYGNVTFAGDFMAEALMGVGIPFHKPYPNTACITVRIPPFLLLLTAMLGELTLNFTPRRRCIVRSLLDQLGTAKNIVKTTAAHGIFVKHVVLFKTTSPILQQKQSIFL